MANKNFQIILKIVIGISILCGIVLFVQTTVDDSYICYRYGYNLVKHGFWNWNPDNDRIEAYTSFTYMMLSVIPPLLNVQPQIIFKIITFFFFLLIIRRIYLLTNNKFYALLVILALTANWQTHVHIYAGLETIFWFYLLIEVFALLYKEDFGSNAQTKLWLLALLLPLTRPEGAVFSLFIFVYILWIKKQKIQWVTLFFFASIGGVYFLWRFWYFGLPLPLSFYHKSVGNNLGWLGLIFNTITAWQYLLLGGFVWYLVRKNTLAKSFFMIVFFLYFVFYGTTALLMNYANRFAFQLFYPAIIFGLIIIANHLSSKEKKRVMIAIFIFIGAIFYKGLFDRMPMQFGKIKDNMLFTAYMQKTHFTIGNQLAALNSPNIKVAIGDAGVIPYLANTKCYDPYGLADVQLSMHHLDEAYFNKMDADLLFISSNYRNEEMLSKDITNIGIMYKIIQKQDTSYTLINKFNTDRGRYNMFCYIKNNSPYKVAIQDAMQKAQVQHDNFKITTKDFLQFKYINNYFQKEN